MGAAVTVLLILVAHADEIGTETCAADGSCRSDMAACSDKHLSGDHNQRWLGSNTTQLHRDYTKPIWGSLLRNQYNGMS